MKTPVKVAVHPETGAVITWNETPGKDGKKYGQMRVEQTLVSLENGIANKSNRSAFITLEESIADLLNYKAGQTISGKITRKESFSPMFEGQSPKINPSTNEEVLVDGKRVYFQDRFTENVNEQDVLIKKVIISDNTLVDVDATTDTLN